MMGVTEKPQSHGWDKVELITENTGIDPLRIAISKLMGLALANISTTHKEDGMPWHKFGQHLIEQYSDCHMFQKQCSHIQKLDSRMMSPQQGI